jgi:hypothetical protein
MVAEEIIHKVVDEIAFGLISPKDLRKQSVVEIQTPDRATILRFAKKPFSRACVIVGSAFFRFIQSPPMLF